MTPAQATEACIKNIPKSNNGLLVIKLAGTLASGKRSEIDIEKIRDAALENGFFYCNVQTGDVGNPGISVSSKTVSEMEIDFLKSKGYKENEIKLAKMLMDMLGEDMTPSELEKAVSEVIKQIDN